MPRKTPKAKTDISDIPEKSSFVTVPEIAKVLGYTPRTICRKMEDGSLPGRKFGGTWRMHRQDFEKLTAPQLPADPPPAPQAQPEPPTPPQPRDPLAEFLPTNGFRCDIHGAAPQLNGDGRPRCGICFSQLVQQIAHKLDKKETDTSVIMLAIRAYDEQEAERHAAA